MGVNLSGGEFTPDALPGVYNKNYIYPSAEEISAFEKIGMNTIRMPVLWERIQPELDQPLNALEMQRIDKVIADAKARHMKVIIDLHNYGQYRGEYIGSSQVPVRSFVNVWEQISQYYLHEPDVIFGLMNEPHKQEAALWADIDQQVINAIRNTGARQLILAPGTRWTGGHSWNKKGKSISNADALSALHDPANNLAIEIHQYFDANYSGKDSACPDANTGVNSLTGVTEWLRKTQHYGFLAEFGGSKEPVCLEAMRNTLSHMQKNSDVWKGWTYWAAGAWLGKYSYSIQSPDVHPQATVLKEFLP